MAASCEVFFFFCFFFFLLSAAQGANFTCSGAAAAKCQALARYVPRNETTYKAVKELFQVDSIVALYGANGLAASTRPSTMIPGGAAVRVPFPCACSEGRGVADGRPIYTVKTNDTLYDIATIKFGFLVDYPQIAAFNKLPDANKIDVGQELKIPLPCSCDSVDDLPTVHLALVVAAGNSTAAIAAEFGTTESTLLRINNMTDPRSLKGDQVLDVPLRACNSSIRSDAVDASLRVPNGSYALTAGDCLDCSCSSSSWTLNCKIANRSTCKAPTCSASNSSAAAISLSLGEIAQNGCGSVRCDYAGYYNTSGLNITAVPVPVNQSGCGTPAPAPSPQSSAPELRPLLASLFAALLLLLSF